MNNKETKVMECPFCKSDLEVDVEFARKNGRIFCGSCCKAFDIKIQDKPQKYIKDIDLDNDYDGMGYF